MADRQRHHRRLGFHQLRVRELGLFGSDAGQTGAGVSIDAWDLWAPLTSSRLVQTYTLDTLRDLLLWLNSWPGGVKLNFELAKVFCDGFLWGTGLWEDGARLTGARFTRRADLFRRGQ